MTDPYTMAKELYSRLNGDDNDDDDDDDDDKRK